MRPGTFLSCARADGAVFEALHPYGRERVTLWDGEASCPDGAATSFGFVLEGAPELTLSHSRHQLTAGCYFSVPGRFEVRGGRGMLIRVEGYTGLASIGGPVEAQGRLKYIDGCTDTLLVSPAKLGDPCLNALFFPPRITQTAHTHPSVRLGAVLRGHGYCDTREGAIALEPGLSFCIPADVLHSFRTEDQALVVIAYHPDSDYGPLDENHPMLNRTIVDGVSAARLPQIQTA